jgi:SAM-dependent methyltransferase
VEATEYERMFALEQQHWWYSGMRSIGFSLLDEWLESGVDGQRRQLLDAGCGTGANLVALNERGAALGLDQAEAALRLCRQRNVTVVRGDLEALPFPEGSFDCVTSFDVLYHLDVRDDRRAAAELARVLRPGGLLLVRVPALEALRRGHDQRVHTRHRYNRTELTQLLEAAGLELLRVTYCNTLLLPLVVARSGLDRCLVLDHSDLAALPASLAWLLRGCLRAEARYLRDHDLPLGASLLALARRPAEA